MKKNSLILSIMFFTSCVFAEKKEFTSFEIKDEKAHLLGLIKCIEFGPTEVPGVVESGHENGQYLSAKEYWALRKKNTMAIMQNMHNNYNVCSQDKGLMLQFLADQKKQEQAELRSFGYSLKSNHLGVFYAQGQDKQPMLGIIDEHGEVKLSKHGRIDPGAAMLIPLPSRVIALDVNCNDVSNEEIGYVAVKMLQNGSDAEINNDRFAMKLTNVTNDKFENKTIDLSMFFPRNS